MQKWRHQVSFAVWMLTTCSSEWIIHAPLSTRHTKCGCKHKTELAPCSKACIGFYSFRGNISSEWPNHSWKFNRLSILWHEVHLKVCRRLVWDFIVLCYVSILFSNASVCLSIVCFTLEWICFSSYRVVNWRGERSHRPQFLHITLYLKLELSCTLKGRVGYLHRVRLRVWFYSENARRAFG